MGCRYFVLKATVDLPATDVSPQKPDEHPTLTVSPFKQLHLELWLADNELAVNKLLHPLTDPKFGCRLLLRLSNFIISETLSYIESRSTRLLDVEKIGGETPFAHHAQFSFVRVLLYKNYDCLFNIVSSRKLLSWTSLSIINLCELTVVNMNAYVWILAIFAAFGGFMFGYDIG